MRNDACNVLIFELGRYIRQNYLCRIVWFCCRKSVILRVMHSALQALRSQFVCAGAPYLSCCSLNFPCSKVGRSHLAMILTMGLSSSKLQKTIHRTTASHSYDHRVFENAG